MNEALKAGGLASTGSVKAGKIGVLLVNLGTPDAPPIGRCVVISRSFSRTAA